jgi:hypothetical protein
MTALDAWGRTFTKSLATLRELKKTAYHHYGNNPFSIARFLYYSGMRVNTFIIYGAELTGESPGPAIDPDFRVIRPSPEELARVRDGRDLTREFYYDQLLGLKTCFLVFRGDELAYIHWVLFKGDHSRFLNLGDGDAEFSYSTTVPEFRGNNLQAKIIAHSCRELRERGYRRVGGAIHQLNIPSIKAVELIGWREIARIKALGPFHRKVALSG